MTDTKDTSTHFDDDLQFDDFDTAASLADEAKPSMERSSNHDYSARFQSDPANNPTNSLLNDQKKLKKLGILAILIIIIVGFIAYHFSSRWNNPLSGISHAPTKIVAQPMAPPTTNIQPAGPSMAEINTELSNKISTLDQTINQQQQTITQLQTNISSLQDSVGGLNSTIDTISQQLSTINDKLTKPTPKIAKAVVTSLPDIHYVVKAMVPGRAWLQANNGTTLSVAVGNSVPTHGTVTQLDLNAGQVTTSDGTVFTYDLNGN